MTKKFKTIEMFQCDFADGTTQCNIEGTRDTVKQCTLCKMDLCYKHYCVITISGTKLPKPLSYVFCDKHLDEFLKTLEVLEL